MAVQQLVFYPHPTLRTQAEEIANPQQPEVLETIQDMKDTLQYHQGIGIAANQIDKTHRVFVLNMDVLNLENPPETEEEAAETGFKVFINPKVEIKSGEEKFEEACLSIPDVKAKIPRAPYIKISALNEVGEPFEFEAVGYTAAAVQHEMDHLDGITIFESMGPVAKRMQMKRYKKLLKRFKSLNASIKNQLG